MRSILINMPFKNAVIEKRQRTKGKNSRLWLNPLSPFPCGNSVQTGEQGRKTKAGEKTNGHHISKPLLEVTAAKYNSEHFGKYLNDAHNPLLLQREMETSRHCTLAPTRASTGMLIPLASHESATILWEVLR